MSRAPAAAVASAVHLSLAVASAVSRDSLTLPRTGACCRNGGDVGAPGFACDVDVELAALVINGLFIDRVPDACPWGFEFLAKTQRREETQRMQGKRFFVLDVYLR